MESATNEGRSDGTGRSEIQPQHNYAEHDAAYFDSSTVQGPCGLPEETKMGTHSTSLKSSDTRSPTPATTPGSTSTPTSPSTGGMSSSEVHKMQSDHGSEYAREHLVESPPIQLQPNRLPAKGENWSASEETTKPQYPSTPSGTGPAAPRENLSPSPCGRHNPAAYPSAVKLLVSNNVAGSIIGRAGQTISELQSQSAARIKLSQTGDFYPGTQDRVCLVQGQLEKVKIAVRLLLERLHMLQEQQHSQHLAWQPMPNESPAPGFDFVVRLLVPSSSCGMIIGKAGSNIKHMEEASGVASVRLSPKETSDPSSPSAAIVAGTSERVVTLTGPKIENCVKCLHIVLDGMMAHHEICRYSNMTTSYSRVVVPGSFNQAPQAGRPVLAVPSDVNPEHTMWEAGGPYNQFEGRRSNSSPDLPAQMIWDQHGGPPRMPSEASSGQMMSPDLPGQMIWDQHGGPPRMPSEPSSGQMMSHHPGETMQPYSPVFADAPASYSHDMAPMMHSPARGPPPSTNAPVYLLPSPSPTQMDQLSMSNSTSAPDLLAMQLQDSLRINNVAPCSAPVDYTHFAPQLPQPTPPGFTAQVLVPDTLIGSILGRGGRTLNELQMQSNTRIRISQRGEYVPGTRNRVVTIRGPTAACVSLAQYLMSQRMVLPPTATYSPQAPYQPSQMQLRHVQQPHMAQQRHDIHPSHYHGPHETAFQPTDSDGQLPPSATP